MIKFFFYLLLLYSSFNICFSANIYWSLDSEKTFHTRLFHKDTSYQSQKNTYAIELSSELFVEPNQNTNFLLVPNYRYDHFDKERSLFDISQGYILYFNKRSELKIGKEKIFWGVTELKNLVDIVNSPDNASGEEKSKLGQTLISYSYIDNNFGFIDLIYMPEFHKPSQVGKKGRLRLNLPTEDYNTVYEGGAGEKTPSWAAKWQNSFGNTDISFQLFRGTSRDTSTIPKIENGQVKYFAGYERVSQFGSFIQKVSGPFIYKFEGIKRNGQKNSLYKRQNYYSYITGLEYIKTRLYQKMWDLNLFLEYSNDDRGSSSTDIFQNDLFLGSRISLNDVDGTEITQTLSLDMDGNGNIGSIEISSRLRETLRITADYRFYWSLKKADTLYSFRKDNYIGIRLTNYF